MDKIEKEAIKQLLHLVHYSGPFLIALIEDSIKHTQRWVKMKAHLVEEGYMDREVHPSEILKLMEDIEHEEEEKT